MSLLAVALNVLMLVGSCPAALQLSDALAKGDGGAVGAQLLADCERFRSACVLISQLARDAPALLNRLVVDANLAGLDDVTDALEPPQLGADDALEALSAEQGADKRSWGMGRSRTIGPGAKVRSLKRSWGLGRPANINNYNGGRIWRRVAQRNAPGAK